MKKKIFFILVVYLLLFPIHSVYAGSYCDSSTISNEERRRTDYKITYDITEFNVGTDGKIKISGWSALDHMDNYGGRNGNMVTEIGVYIPGTQKKKYYEVTFTNNIDFYPLRCSGGRCTANIRRDIINKIKNNRKILEGSTCIWSPSEYYSLPSRSDGGSHCAYHNLGFNINLNIDEIVKDLGISTETSVKFTIRTTVYYGKKLSNVKTNNQKKTDESDLGIIIKDSNTVCKIYNRDCVENRTMSTTRRTTVYGIEYTQKLKISGLSDKVYFSTVGATRYSNNYSNISNCFFTFNQNYNIQEIGDIKRYSHNAGRISTRRIKIDDSWAYMFWVKPSGGITLTLTPAPPDVPSSCPTADYCVGSNCKYDKNNCPIPTKSLNSATCPDLDKRGCANASYKLSNCDKIVNNSDYYFRVSDADFKDKYKFGNYVLSASESRIQHMGGYYYFPITISAIVSYQQDGDLTIKDFENNQTIVSGLNFAYSYQYTVSSKWNYKNYTLDINISGNDKTSNNTIGVIEDVLIKKKGEKTTKKARIIISLKENDELYVNNGNSFVKYKDFYSMQALQDAVAKGAKENGKSIDATDNKVTFDDSNDASDASKKRNTSDAGTFSCSSTISTDNWGAGVSRSSTCFYKIKKAFFSNQMNGNIIYRDSDSIAGYYVDPNNKDGVNSWYYIPANLKTGDTFEFIVKNTNLSLIKGVNFTYNATCSVKGKNEIHDSNKIKYRSIDTSNPFPKATKISDYPKNWQQYVNDKGLNRIISNSFSGISYQTNFFKNKSYIDGLKITYGDYYSYNDMDTNGNGTSAIIHKENLFSKINGNYNKAGEYKEEKDKVQS